MALGTESTLAESGHPNAPDLGQHGAGASSAGASRWGPTVVRAGSHGLIWATVLVPAFIEVSNGWRSVRDNAVITLDSSRVFSAQSPVVGMWSLASTGMRHAFFDLGPVPFWLLAVPVHLDPGQGALWGAALVCGGALSLAAEAAWSVRGWPACLAVALVVADLGWQTQMFADPVWNPHFGLTFMIAAAAAAWAVASGRFGWWPLLVLSSSVAAQSHLIYVAPAVALAVIGPLAGLAYGHKPRRWRWPVVGLAVGAACWVAPLAQQAFGHPGNLSLVLGSGTAHTHVGLGFGLHSLATAVSPRPIWLTQYPYLAAFGGGMPHYLSSHATVWAAIAACLMVAIAVAAWLARRRELSALALISIVIALTTVASFGAFPKADLTFIGYLGNYLWVVGMLAWIVAAWAMADCVLAGADRWRRRRRQVGVRTVLVRGLEVAAVIALGMMAFEAMRTLSPAAHQRVATVRTDLSLDSAIVRSVERSVARGPVIVEVRPPAFGPSHGFYTIDYWGIGWELVADGWRPALPPGNLAEAIKLSVPPGAHWPKVIIHVDPSTRAITRVQRVAPTT
jgi:hypothetical protein